MAEKYIVQNNSITKIVYIGGCQSAKGGRQKIREQADLIEGRTILDEGIKVAEIREKISNGTKIHGEYHEKNFRAREKNRKRAVEELIVNNFEPRNACMLTLTFSAHEQTAKEYEEIPADDFGLIADLDWVFSESEPRGKTVNQVKIYDPQLSKYGDLSFCNKLFKQFIQRMRYRFPLFRYVAVMAQQDNGNWHYHLVCNLNYIPFDELRSIWGNGAVYFRSFKQTGLSGMWKAVRYLQKNMRIAQLEGDKGYLASKGLQRNLVFRSWKPEEVQQCQSVEKILENRRPDMSYENFHEYYGMADEIFDKKLTATTKYFKYLRSNHEQFPKLPNAYRAKRRI